MNDRSHRWPPQPAPVIDTAAQMLAALLAESAGKRDDRGPR